jgi:hypothetical protein
MILPDHRILEQPQLYYRRSSAIFLKIPPSRIGPSPENSAAARARDLPIMERDPEFIHYGVSFHTGSRQPDMGPAGPGLPLSLF